MSEVKELIEFDKIAAGISDMQEKGNFIPDMSTKEGYEASKRFVLDETTPTRTRLDKAHKTAKEYWKLGGQNVDKKKNEILDLLVVIQKPHQEAYKAFDQEKKDKKAKFEADLQFKIDVFSNYKFLPPNYNSDVIANIIQECGETDTIEGFYHRAKEAELAKQDAMLFLNDALMSAVNYEAQQQREAELAEENRLRQIQIDEQQEAMRLQQEKMDAQQADIDAKHQAQIDIELKIDQEKRQVEYDRKLKIENEEREKQDEIERKQRAIEREEYAQQQAKEAAEQAKQYEIERQQEEKRLDDEAAAKREANKRHNGKINKAILKVLVDNGIPEDHAKTMVILAAKRELPQLTINY